MVSKKELLKKIALLESENEAVKKENTELKEELEARDNNDKQMKMLFNALRALNKKVNKHIKGEQEAKDENDVIEDWLKDDRVDEVQSFLHKGVK
jgi:hypothetical protein